MVAHAIWLLPLILWAIYVKEMWPGAASAEHRMIISGLFLFVGAPICLAAEIAAWFLCAFTRRFSLPVAAGVFLNLTGVRFLFPT